jgi:lathosterol oxidase
VGGPVYYLLWLAAYIVFVEWGIFWIHRLLHWNLAYKLLHKPHHIYNNNLTPFAGLAFHPVDGMLQATPYLLGIFFLPVHFWTHEALLFFTAVWTANIHDALVGDTEPIMGSAYHTIHHTDYRDNYGQFFVLFDWLHDTLTPPKHRVEMWRNTGTWTPRLTAHEQEELKKTGKKAN